MTLASETPAAPVQPTTDPAPGDWRMKWISLALVAITLLAFGRMVVQRHDYVMYDDHLYVFHNEIVDQGFTLRGFGKAWTSVVAANWHPLTVLSHMLDVEMFGVDRAEPAATLPGRFWNWLVVDLLHIDGPTGHHLVSLLFHTANTVLLFYVMQRMTGAVWPSALVAALFAWHPLHVESVAWVSERKDVLSTFFWLLTMWAYLRYVAAPSWQRYVGTFVLLGLGLLSKPMVVTLPFVLLLLDYWPLRRFQASRELGLDWRQCAWRLLLEKAPMLFLVAVFCGVTLWAQSLQQAVMSVELLPRSGRLINVLMSYNQYVAKALWPHPLAVPYTLTSRLFDWRIATLSGIGLVLVTGLIAVASRKRPYLIVGWLWYLGTLVPVIGFVQVGSQSMADRYSYIPLIGLGIMAAFWLRDFCLAREERRLQVVGATVLVLGVLAALTFRQVGYWRDTVELFTHTLWNTERNHTAHTGLGTGYARVERYEDALEQFEIALDLAPSSGGAHFNRGHVLNMLDREEEAIEEFETAISLKHEVHNCWFNIGVTYLEMEDYDRSYEAVLESLRQGRVRSAPKFLGLCEEFRGNDAEAARWYEQALQNEPNDDALICQLVFIYAASEDERARNGQRAVELANAYAAWYEARHGHAFNPLLLSAQAAAYAEIGDFDRARGYASRALQICEVMLADGRREAMKLRRKIERQLGEYRQGRPYRKPPAELDALKPTRRQTTFQIE